MISSVTPFPRQPKTLEPFGEFDPSRDFETPPARRWMVDAMVMRGTVCLLTGEPDVGKCLGKGTPVLMYDGTIKAVEDVRRGDKLMGPDSQPRTVLTTTKGYGPLYRVTPHNGSDSYVANEDHVLSFKMSPQSRQRLLDFPVNLSVSQYLALAAHKRHHLKAWKPGLINWPRRDLIIPPYLLGLWLGDGASNGTSFTTADQEIHEALEEYATGTGLRIVEYKSTSHGRAKTFAVSGEKGRENPLRAALRCYGVWGNKRIPDEYLINDEGSRLELLAGLIDTDGHYVRHANGYEITQKRRELARQIVFLARSLGFFVSITQTLKKSQVSELRPYHRVFISGEVARIPVRLPHKKARRRITKNDCLLSGVSVNPIGDGEYYGFSLDKDCLFLLGDFTVTHNSRLLQQLMTCFALGRPWLSREVEQANAFAFFLEDDNDELRRRQQDINSHLEIMPHHLEGRFVWNTRERAPDAKLIDFDRNDKPVLTDLWHQLGDFCREYEIQVIGIDTVTPAFGGDHNRAGVVNAIVSECRRLAMAMDGCVILNTHPSKSRTGYSGSIQWEARPRAAMAFKRPEGYAAAKGIAEDDRILHLFKGNYARKRVINVHWQDGVFVTDEPGPPPMDASIAKWDLDARVMAGVRRVRSNGGLIPADEDTPGSIAHRARKLNDDYLGRMPLNALAISQDRLIAAGQLVRVWAKVNRKLLCLIRPTDGTKYDGEESAGQE